MSQAPAMPMFVDAMLGDTLHLDSELFGAYHFILYATWRANGQPLRDDDAVLARVCRMPLARWRKVRPVLEAFFDLSRGTWRQKRLEQEWNWVQERGERSRQNGAKGGRPRLKDEQDRKPKRNPEGNPNDNPAGNPEVTRRQSPHTHTHTQIENPTVPSVKDAAGAERRGAVDPDPVDALIRVLDDAIIEHFPISRPSRHPQDRAIARGWLERGVTVEFARDVIEPIVGRRAADGQDAPQTLKFFLDPMVRALAARGPAEAVTAPPDPEHEAKAARFNKAFLAWSHDGRQGQAPRPEDFGLPPFGAGKAA